jgi:ubiquinone/menaquinone biosynthesis C-methylase UbiE
MSYTIDEANLERQVLLGKVMNPLTRPILERVPLRRGARILDLGCGQGNATRLLADVYSPAECLGIEYDQKLVDFARAHPDNPPCVRFEQGDATKLPFANGSFDLVFARYLLVHLPDPIAVIREMLRIAGPAGYVVSYEPDCASNFTWPPSWAYDKIATVWGGLFADPTIGRKLVHYFRAAGAALLDCGAVQGMDTGQDFKRTYRLSIEATGPAMVAQGLLTPDEHGALLAEMIRVEQDPEIVCFKMPDMWVIARAATP